MKANNTQPTEELKLKNIKMLGSSSIKKLKRNINKILKKINKEEEIYFKYNTQKIDLANIDTFKK